MENIVIDDSFLIKFLGEIVCWLFLEEIVFINLWLLVWFKLIWRVFGIE